MIGYPVHTRKSSEDKVRFIELTERHEPKRKLIVNVNYILSVWEHDGRTDMMLSTGDVLGVQESYSAVHETIFKP